MFGVVWIICFTSVAIIVIIFGVEEIFSPYSDVWDFISDVIFPCAMAVAGVSFLIGIIALPFYLVSVEKSSEYLENKYDSIIESLEENPFNKEVLKDVIDWNSKVEEYNLDNVHNKDNEENVVLTRIDYKVYQREYAIKYLSMTEDDLKDSSSIYKVSEQEIIEINKYIQSLIDENNNLKSEIERMTNEKNSVLDTTQTNPVITINKETGKIEIPALQN